VLRDRSPLALATIALVAASVLHDLDHVRQGRAASVEVEVTAVFAWVATIVLVVLVARHHRLAPLYAAVFGATTAIGFVLVHGLPHWSAFSASYGEEGVDALSWLLAAVPFVAGIALSVCGVREMRADTRSIAGGAQRRSSTSGAGA
jgi:hypothetical protein